MIMRHISYHTSTLRTSGRAISLSKRSMYVQRPESMTCLITKQDELATVQDNVSTHVIGEMRMQFWRDAVKSLGVVRHSSVEPLAGDERDVGKTPTSPHRASVARCFAEY